MKKVFSLFTLMTFVAACSGEKTSNPPSNDFTSPPAKDGTTTPEAGVVNPKTPSLPDGPIVSPNDPVKAGQKFSRVIYIVFENENQKQVISNAYFKALSLRGANFTNLLAEIHPSQGNYIAMVAGDTYGINHDGNITLNVPHLGDLLESKNKTWKAYAEGFPGNCFAGSGSGKYARKHVPFMSFANVTTSKTRCANVVNEKTFFTDWKTGKLPNFSMYIPDLNNDGHDTSVDYSAQWLKKNFETAFNDAALMKDTLVILTYDESAFTGGNKVFGTFLGPMVKAGSSVTASHSHFSLLKMIEDDWELGSLNRNDAKAAPIIGIWK